MKTIRRPLVVLAILQIFGILIYDFFPVTPPKPLLEREVSLTGKVAGIEERLKEGGKSYDLTIKDLSSSYSKLLLKLDENRMLSLLGKNPGGRKRLHIGDRITFSGKFKKFQRERNEGGFNAESYYKNAGFDGFVKAKTLFLLKDKGTRKFGDSVNDFFYQLRERAGKNFRFILGERKGGTLSAMVLGDRGYLDSSVKELYSDNAISHLLAISGLHISIIGFLIYLLCQKARFPYAVSAVIPIFFLLLYALFTGFSVSAMRAVIMMVVLFFSYLLRRSYDIASALAFSGILILSFQHRLLYQAAFQLSFMAVVSIIYGLRLTEKIFGRERRKKLSKPVLIKIYVLSSIIGTLTIQLMMLPILLWHFYEISLNGIFLNIIVIPLMSILVVTGLVGGLLSYFSFWLGSFVLGSSDFILGFYDFLCRLMLENQWNKVILGKPSVLGIILYYSIIYFVIRILSVLGYKEELLFFKGEIEKADRREVKRVKQIFLFIFVPLALFVLLHKKPESFIKRLDMGQGSCKVLRTSRGKNYVVDCGSASLRSPGKNELIPFLKYHGIGKVEIIFITDFKKDRVSGLLELLEKKEIRIERLMIPYSFKGEEGKNLLLSSILSISKKREIRVDYLEDGTIKSDGEYQFHFAKNKVRGERKLLIQKTKEK